MTPEALQKRRQLSPTKLKRARLNAQKTNVAEVAREIGIDRAAYLRWEMQATTSGAPLPPLTHIDYVALNNALVLFNVSYEDVTDPILEPEQVPA
ncbi:hypothetical protein [Deinococcus ruber]|nr:hypothetical protein [Deinococcus ruber]